MKWLHKGKSVHLQIWSLWRFFYYWYTTFLPVNNISIYRDPKKALEEFIITAIASLLETEQYAKKQNESTRMPWHDDAVARVWRPVGTILHSDKNHNWRGWPIRNNHRSICILYTSTELYGMVANCMCCVRPWHHLRPQEIRTHVWGHPRCYHFHKQV